MSDWKVVIRVSEARIGVLAVGAICVDVTAQLLGLNLVQTVVIAMLAFLWGSVHELLFQREQSRKRGS